MREGEPSHTASWVAFLRGLASLGRAPVSHDPYAVRLLGWPYAVPLRLGGVFPRVSRGFCAIQDALDGGRMRHFELRSAAIDAALVAFSREHADATLVVLGAGLDARAYRLKDVFARSIEIDHPSTQPTKRRRLEQAGIASDHVTFAPCDFSDRALVAVGPPSLATPLAGNSSAVANGRALVDVLAREVTGDRPVAVVWEGVTMYLDAVHIDASLDALAKYLPSKSLLAVTYLAAKPTKALDIAVRAAGEQFRFYEGSERFADRLKGHRFRVTEDTGDTEWNRRFLERPTRAGGDLAERLAVAILEG